MDRVNKIWNHPLYRKEYNFLKKEEEKWIFCGHSIEHFLDVARLMQIYNYENNLGLEKDIIYSAALLHDLGRAEQIRSGMGHHQASAKLASKIMKDCDFSDADIEMVYEAILYHRGSDNKDVLDGKDLENYTKVNKLKFILYKADKKCRNCFSCNSFEECNWPMEKRNMDIRD